METILNIFYILVALLLIGIILIQQPKSGGASLFMGTGQSLLGTSARSFWTKFTTVLAVFFMIVCLILDVLPQGVSNQSSVTGIIQHEQREKALAAQKSVQSLPIQTKNKGPVSH
jgi:protein translocase SecG subunit